MPHRFTDKIPFLVPKLCRILPSLRQVPEAVSNDPRGAIYLFQEALALTFPCCWGRNCTTEDCGQAKGTKYRA